MTPSRRDRRNKRKKEEETLTKDTCWRGRLALTMAVTGEREGQKKLQFICVSLWIRLSRSGNCPHFEAGFSCPFPKLELPRPVFPPSFLRAPPSTPSPSPRRRRPLAFAVPSQFLSAVALPRLASPRRSLRHGNSTKVSAVSNSLFSRPPSARLGVDRSVVLLSTWCWHVAIDDLVSRRPFSPLDIIADLRTCSTCSLFSSIVPDATVSPGERRTLLSSPIRPHSYSPTFLTGHLLPSPALSTPDFIDGTFVRLPISTPFTGSRSAGQG